MNGNKNADADTLFMEAERLYRQGAYADAFPLYMELAKRRRVGCKRFIGWMYFSGEGVGRSIEEAYAWFVKAAMQGDGEASFGAGRASLSMGRSGDALEWFAKGCTLGFAPACFRLGWMYQRGKGCERNPALACRCYQEAYRDGNLHAGRALALMQVTGMEGFLGRISGAWLWLRLFVKVAATAARDPQNKSLMA